MNKEFIVLSRQDAVARNNSPYVNLKVANNEEVENICVFDVPKLSGPKVGQLVRFLNIRENQGKKSATNMDMIVGSFPTEDHPLYKLVPRPIKREVWDATLEALIGFCKDERLIGFIKEQAAALFPLYCKYPAATSVHHAFPGGLVNHTWQMLHLLEGIYPVYPYPDDIKIERIIVGILFHDWGKLCEYNIEGEKLENGYLLGHIYMSSPTERGRCLKPTSAKSISLCTACSPTTDSWSTEAPSSPASPRHNCSTSSTTSQPRPTYSPRQVTWRRLSRWARTSSNNQYTT